MSTVRVPLSRERVVDRAIALADAGSIEGLSMRKLAKDLGFEVMSLYNHVGGKDELFAAMVESVAGEFELPAPRGAPVDGWKAALRASALSVHGVLLRHPWAARIWWSTESGPVRLEFMESLLRAMREGGLPASVAYHGYHALTMHLLGFTLQEVAIDIDATDLYGLASEFLSTLDTERFPHFAEHVHQHIDGTRHEGDFVYVLDLILDGLERAAEVPTVG